MTSSDIAFNAQDIDFGFCTVLESVKRTVSITNKSILPQPFGFCGVPEVSKHVRHESSSVDVWLSFETYASLLA